MNIFSILMQEHKAVKEIFAEIEATTERAEKTREELYKDLHRELHSHAVAEQETLYTRLAEEEQTKHLIAEAKEEHALVERLLAQLAETKTTDIEWTAKAKVLQENVEHHVKEEERELFKQAKRVLTNEEAEQLGEDFLTQKEKIFASLS